MILYENITEEAFGFAIKKAVQKLAELKAGEVCNKTGGEKISEDMIRIKYLNMPYLVELKSGKILDSENKESLPLRDKIILLHYLTDAKGSPITGKLISYAQIEGGKFYFPVFHKRTVEPMIRFFAKDPEKLLKVSEVIGAKRERYGDLSISLSPLPFVKIYFIFWRGDEDIPPNGNILFDKNITDLLCAEDIAVLTEIVTWRIIKAAGTE